MDPVRYLVYIKKAAPNLLKDQSVSTEYGHLNGDGTYTKYINSSRTPMKLPGTSGSKPVIQIVSNFIKIDQDKQYILKEILRDGVYYTIYGYDAGYHIVPNSAQNFTPESVDQFYKPRWKSKDIRYVRIIIRVGVGLDYNTGSFPKKTPGDSNLFIDRINSLMFLEYSLVGNDITLIHDSNSPEISDHLVNPVLELADSSAGSFSFTMPKIHKYYNEKINIWTDTIYIIRVLKNDHYSLIWDGRPINLEQDALSGDISYYCEGSLSYFNDRRIDSTISGSILDGDAAQLSVKDFLCNIVIQKMTIENGYIYNIDRAFSENDSLHLIDVDKDSKFLFESDSRDSCLKWLNNIVESFGAHMKIIYNPMNQATNVEQLFNKMSDPEKRIDRYLYIVQDLNDYLEQKAPPNRYELPKIHTTFGSSIFNSKKIKNGEGVITSIIPRGMQVDPVVDGVDCYIYLNTTAASIGGETKHFDSRNAMHNIRIIDRQLVREYGFVEAIVDFESADSPTQLEKEAKKWFTKYKENLIKTSIEISLYNFENPTYTWNALIMPLADTEYIDIWTAVYATIPELDINEEELFYVVGLSIPLDDHLNTRVTLSHHSKMISDDVISAGDIKGVSKGIISK